MYKANTTKNVKGLGPILLELYPFVILNGFCMCSFPKYLEVTDDTLNICLKKYGLKYF